MAFWIVAALLTLGVCVAILRPLSREHAHVGSRAHDIEVYRDQLAEIDRDAARGQIGQVEAEQARSEIGRRILRISDAGSDEPSGRRPGRAGGLIGAAAVLAVPLFAWSIYAVSGSPQYPSQPLQARLSQDPSTSSPEELIARAEQHLAQNPEDARGWEVLAPIYLRLERYADAATAFRNAIRVDGETSDRQAGLGQALAGEGGGVVTEDALSAFSRALELDETNFRAKYFLALALAQEGDTGSARLAWETMLDGLPADSPWRQLVADATARLDDASAVSSSQGGQSEMIEGMVSGLAERLERNPNDVDGWQQLIRSYMVLGRESEAQSALNSGLAALGEDSPEGGHLTAFGLSLGLASTQ